MEPGSFNFCKFFFFTCVHHKSPVQHFVTFCTFYDKPLKTLPNPKHRVTNLRPTRLPYIFEGTSLNLQPEDTSCNGDSAQLNQGSSLNNLQLLTNLFLRQFLSRILFPVSAVVSYLSSCDAHQQAQQFVIGTVIFAIIKLSDFKVCMSVHHHTIQTNQSTRCNNSSGLLLDVYVQLNMFRASLRPSSGAQLQQQPLVLVVVGQAGPTTTNSIAISTL